MKNPVLLAMGVCIGLAVVALSSFGEEKKALTDEGELSFVQTEGNTKVASLAAKNLMKYKFTENLLGSWKAGAMRADTAGVKTAENYFTDFKLDYLNTPRLYSFVTAGWMQNKFAGVDEHVYGGAGAGYKLLDGPNNFLIGELGVLYVTDKYVDNVRKNYPSGRAFAKYTYAFTEKNKSLRSLREGGLTVVSRLKDGRYALC